MSPSSPEEFTSVVIQKNRLLALSEFEPGQADTLPPSPAMSARAAIGALATVELVISSSDDLDLAKPFIRNGL